MTYSKFLRRFWARHKKDVEIHLWSRRQYQEKANISVFGGGAGFFREPVTAQSELTFNRAACGA